MALSVFSFLGISQRLHGKLFFNLDKSSPQITSCDLLVFYSDQTETRGKKLLHCISLCQFP